MYRTFISRPTAEDGNPVPVESSVPTYFRVRDYDGFTDSLAHVRVSVWDGQRWIKSMFPNFFEYLNDVLGGGATVREILDERELPDA